MLVDKYTEVELPQLTTFNLEKINLMLTEN